jgi:hypothetical protein
MRKTALTLLASAAIGLAGLSLASAAPLNPAPLGQSGAAVDNLSQVQHWRWGSGGHWRWGSGGHGGGAAAADIGGGAAAAGDVAATPGIAVGC